MTRWMKCVTKCWMKRAAFAILAALILWPPATSAHDVPDNVSIVAFLKPENGRMLILVRMPANALIDFIFPTLFDSNWLDLKNINGLPEDGAKVWIADLLSIYEDDNALPTPKVIAARLSRAGDSSFNTFQDAFSLVNGDRLPTDSLLTQDTATVDALLETPIRSVDSHFSFEPRFERVGVRVTTTLSFLPPNGGIRQFQYEGDPETFELNPSWNYAVARFFRAGFAHYLSESDYLLFLLCVALVFRRLRVLAWFSVAFATAQSFALVSSLKLIGSTQHDWLISVDVVAAMGSGDLRSDDRGGHGVHGDRSDCGRGRRRQITGPCNLYGPDFRFGLLVRLAAAHSVWRNSSSGLHARI